LTARAVVAGIARSVRIDIAVTYATTVIISVLYILCQKISVLTIIEYIS